MKRLTVLVLGCALAACGQSNQEKAAAVATLQQQVAELQAREAIRELFTSYGRTLDGRDFKAFGQLFAKDSEYVGGGGMGTSHGPDEIAAALEKVITTNASGANLHMYANEHINVTDGDTATALSRGAFYVQDEKGGPKPLMWATYKDEFVRENGTWKFKRREVIGDIPGPSNEQRAGLVPKTEH
jgi:uncharacterized protein (TIGR02246 family)